MTKCHFVSDNAAGVHPEVMAMMAKASRGHAIAYGNDPFTKQALQLFKQHFGTQTETFFVLTGTAANVIALQSVMASFEAVICADCAHLHRDECGAPEKFLGSKVLVAKTHQGKLSVETVAPLLRGMDIVHRAQPKVLSITQCTEWGTIYTSEEIQTLADFCHEHGLLLHMDGARLSNAAARLNLSLKEITGDVGVDLLSFGGTKNGLLAAEAIVFFDPELAKNAPFYRKQGMHLVSKMRFVSAQFLALLSDDLWRRNAQHANGMAALLAERLGNIAQVEIIAPVETNGVFARIPSPWVPRLQQHYAFAVWDPASTVVRWMTSFDTTAEEVRNFERKIQDVSEENPR
ncbi:Threonine aldolase [Nitrosococcus halophilus Nc 4]|uniref:Threonine aldolase n=1 Tax=Nitrosococcus halophilus (strain Nc4) TaxID=472759 RepID=D5C1G5_NITHN|nr:low specificity L-threonine aldolase [Nitrosococcus halophilus]ADE16517.1 Threonine aldolase [Nitrosococcus halophilus Nc 4]